MQFFGNATEFNYCSCGVKEGLVDIVKAEYNWHDYR